MVRGVSNHEAARIGAASSFETHRSVTDFVHVAPFVKRCDAPHSV